ncbi:hypothetical protein DFR70_11392 [Nocardia tenerifensis]|uniref:Uncharacterized protein n=1 Tax=Nocardia tenerifensis TaxID=228006 RepID=A0A318JXW1_9NOCA|nr:hypothetical protein [Nocardia tenerifensis]PXX58757.1 hypothetical protein DFR70_11392 [Nocardia tenerifensis]
MVELFRFIQQAFVVSDSGNSIDLTTQSAFQRRLRELMSGPYALVRAEAEKYIDGVTGSGAATLADGGLARLAKYTDLRAKLLALSAAQARTTTPPPSLSGKVSKAIKDVFGQEPADLVASQQFKDELVGSGDILVAVKITTRFDRVDAPSITVMRQVIAFVADFVAGRADPLTIDRIHTLLDRPVRIPEEFFPRPGGDPQVRAKKSEPDAGAARLAELSTEQAAFQRAYDLVMTARPNQLAIHTDAQANSAADEQEQSHALTEERERSTAVPSVIGLTSAALAAMDPVVRDHLAAELSDVATASVPDILGVLKRRRSALAREVEPSRLPRPAQVYRLGNNLFAVPPNTDETPETDPPVPDFSHAITRPVGVGDLQVVRQELIGYVPADISHIENVLPGELLKKTTKREETSELIVTESTESTQSAERDTQTAERNELASEASKEAGEQSSATQDQTSTSNYGRLVENSKTNYARSVTDRAVNKLTQSVKQERTQREKKVYTEETVHQLDNANGLRAIRGIYQWVDKKYKTRVVNYGKRLLYDVVVPEPASFLIESLKAGAQKENFQLTRPQEPTVTPAELDATNYMYWAALYGVTGAVTPPPEELVRTFANVEKGDAGKALEGNYGISSSSPLYGQHFNAVKIPIPDGYAAIGGYVQRTNRNFVTPDDPEEREFEFFIGESTFLRFIKNGPLNQSFTLRGETGEIPVTLRTFAKTLQFNYAVGIVCRRTDAAMAKWQLDTHAKIVAGYQRQRTEFLDQLGRYQTAVRTQLSLATAFSHDSTTEREELKKAFIHLLMSEHFDQVGYPAPQNPQQFPGDPRYIKQWGAVVAFFERAFEWEHLMYLFYPYFWGREKLWGELVLIQDVDAQFEAFLKAGAARVVIPVRPGFEAALAHFHETGDVWMGEEIPDMFSDRYVSIIAEIKARNATEAQEVVVDEWEVRLPTTLVMLRDDAQLPSWTPAALTAGDGE